MAETSLDRWKTLREKEKLLVTSNFSFSHSVFKRLALQTRKNQGLFRKGLVFADNKINKTQKYKFVFGREENMGKGENAGYMYQHFLLFPQYFQKGSLPG